AATAAAAPPLDPPAVMVGSHGLRVGGPSAVSQYSELPNSLVAVLPRLIAPAARRAATTSASRVGTEPANTVEPCVVRTPAVRVRSLIAIGTPASGGSGSPAATARSTASARARAVSAVTAKTGPRRGCGVSVRR